MAERLFKKKALHFIIQASRSESILSALEFFNNHFTLVDMDKDTQDDYRDYWVSMVMDTITLLPHEKRKLLSASFVESVAGFRLPGDVLRYDIIAWKSKG
jgi:hypothetical protein